MINSKRKGNKNERTGAKVVSAWIGLKFTKVPASGGMRLKDTSLMAGDLMSEEPISLNPDDINYMPFIFETKALSRVPYTTPLPDKSKLRNIWKQAMTDSIRSNRIPIALIRENGMPKESYLLIIGSLHFDTLQFSRSIKPLFISDPYKGYFVGYDSKAFFENISYKTFCNAIRSTGSIQLG